MIQGFFFGYMWEKSKYVFLHTQQYVGTNISFRNTHFLRTLLLGLLSPNGNGRGICIRTYIHLSMYKINFGSYVRTAPFATIRKLDCGTPTHIFSFVKKMGAQFSILCVYIATQIQAGFLLTAFVRFQYFASRLIVRTDSPIYSKILFSYVCNYLHKIRKYSNPQV